MLYLEVAGSIQEFHGGYNRFLNVPGLGDATWPVERCKLETVLISSLALAFALASGPVEEVPFRIGDDAIIVDVTVNGCKASLMFDTGFSGSVIVGDNLDVGKPTGTQTLTDFVGSFEAKTVKMTSLKIGDKSVDPTGMEITVQPSDHYTLSYGTHCDGILGLQAFAGRVFEINFERQKFIFHPDSLDITQSKVDGTKSFITKLLPLGVNSLMMSVDMASGEKLHMALDTGNSGYATTHKDALERAKVWPDGKAAEYMGRTVVASGPVDTFRVSLSNIKIFGVSVPESVFNVIDLPASRADQDGTVGFGFLKNFNITIDSKRRRVLFENFTGRMSDPLPADVGVLAFNDPRVNRMRVFWVVPGGPAEKAGIKRGDDLLAVNGDDVSQIGFRRLDTMLKGDVGSKVKLDLSRGGQLIRLEVERKVLVNSLDK